MNSMKTLYTASSVIHWFVGLGAAAGGTGAILNPNSPMGMPIEALKNGPFKNYLIPGLFLALIIGLCNIVAGFLVLKKVKYHEAASGAMGAILAAWIVIQCLVLWAVNYLHVIFFIIGITQGILALALIYKNRAFPYSIIESAREKLGGRPHQNS